MHLFVLAAYLSYVLVAAGWRMWLQYRRTGDMGLRAFRGGSVAAVASALLIGALVVATAGLVSALLGWTPSIEKLDGSILRVSGAALFASGFLLTLIAQLQIGDSWRIGLDPRERTALVTHGVFGYVRNPIFTGMLLTLGGLVLLVPNGWTLASLILALAGLELQVRGIEEPFLLRTHGDHYRAYTRRTGRFVPRVGFSGSARQ